MKIKLLRTPSFDVQFKNRPLTCSILPPLGIATLTSYIKTIGMDVEQDDLNIKTHNFNKNPKNENKIDFSIFLNKKRIKNYITGGNDEYLEETLSKIADKTNFKNVDVLGLSIHDNLTDVPMLITLSLARYLKEKYEFSIVIGSEIPDLVLETFKIGGRLNIIDYAIVGEGQIGLHKLLNNIEVGKKLSDVPNLLYYENGKIIENKSIMDNNFYLPCFDGLPIKEYTVEQPIKNYKIDNLPKNKVLILPYRFIKGCPNKCIFCPSSTQKRLIALPPEKVADDIETLRKKYKCRYFYFLNATINISEIYVNKLCDEINKHDIDIRWTDSARLNHLNKKTLLNMKKSGVVRLVFGLETGSPRMLNYIQKNLTIDEAQKNLKLSHRMDIWNCVEIIIGLPHENEIDAKKTINFINKNSESIDTIFMHPFNLRPSELLKNPFRYGITNVQRIMKWSNRGKEPLNKRLVRYRFDEIGGLKWNEKRKKTNIMWKTAHDSVNKKMRFISHFEKMPLLFYLYDIFNNKKNVREIYEIVKNSY